MTARYWLSGYVGHVWIYGWCFGETPVQAAAAHIDSTRKYLPRDGAVLLYLKPDGDFGAGTGQSITIKGPDASTLAQVDGCGTVPCAACSAA